MQHAEKYFQKAFGTTIYDQFKSKVRLNIELEKAKRKPGLGFKKKENIVYHNFAYKINFIAFWFIQLILKKKVVEWPLLKLLSRISDLDSNKKEPR